MQPFLFDIRRRNRIPAEPQGNSSTLNRFFGPSQLAATASAARFARRRPPQHYSEGGQHRRLRDHCQRAFKLHGGGSRNGTSGRNAGRSDSAKSSARAIAHCRADLTPRRARSTGFTVRPSHWKSGVPAASLLSFPRPLVHRTKNKITSPAPNHVCQPSCQRRRAWRIYLVTTGQPRGGGGAAAAVI